MNLTPAQRAAVDHRDGNLLVAASAGSGKTEVLARRCVALLSDPREPCTVEQLLVVTFTRAAAAELRVRIAAMLRQVAAFESDPPRRDHLRRQAILIDTAEIGTIDAWCARLVRENFAAAGVDPGFCVLSPEQAGLLHRDALAALLDWVYTSEEDTPRAGRAWLALHDRPSDEFLRQALRGLHAFREHLVDPPAWLARQRARTEQPPARLRSEAERLLAEAIAAECRFQRQQLAGMLSDTRAAGIAALLGEYAAALETWERRLGDPACLLEVVADIDGYRFRKPRGAPAASALIVDELKESWHGERLKKRWSLERLTPIVEHAARAAEYVRLLIDLEQRYYELVFAEKQRRAAYEFGDVLRFALNLLGEPDGRGGLMPTPLAQRMRRRYAQLLVDEVQDTSPVQIELLRLAAREGPRAGNRFLVGDLKQSIYGFREAEPRLLTELIARFNDAPEEGSVLPLSDNFRSHARLLDDINALFAGLFDPALGGTPYGQAERLVPRRDEIANPTLDQWPRVEIHTVPERDKGAPPPQADGGLPLELIQREAHVAMECIRGLMGESGAPRALVPQRGEDGALSLRPLRYDDIVVLLRTARGHAALLAAALRDAGIPCVAGGRESLLDCLEVLDVRNVLALLANRQQDLPLAAYLRGPLVGLSANELLEIRRAQPRGPFHEALSKFARPWLGRSGPATEPAPQSGGDPNALGPRVGAALRRLDRWVQRSRETDLPALLRLVLGETGLELFAQALPGGAHRVAMLHTLIQFAADFAGAGGQGPGEFVALLDALEQQGSQAGGGMPLDTDAVRIMTIHAAKGLEFPVVLLMGAGTSFRARGRQDHPALRCDERTGIGLDFFDYPARTRLRTAPGPIIRYCGALRELEEELRLLYVAATRAREKLLIIGHGPPEAPHQARDRFGGKHSLPLMSRLNADSMLAWLLMSAAAAELPSEQVIEHPDVPEWNNPSDATRAALSSEPADEQQPCGPSAEDRAWLERSQQLLAASPDTTLAQAPAVISVSLFKQMLAAPDEERAAPLPDAAGYELPARLALPAFAAKKAKEPASAADSDRGRMVGSVLHRFMQHADLRELASPRGVQAQAEALVAAALLTPAQAAMLPIEAIAWLAASATGELLARHAQRCRREIPFVYALPLDSERVIVRGVIDCIIELDEGLLLLDYKTDQPPRQLDWLTRLAGYEMQLRLYGQAAAEIFARPIAGLQLVLLGQRTVHAVPPQPIDLACLQHP